MSEPIADLGIIKGLFPAELGSEADAALDLLVKGATAWLEGRMNRILVQATYAGELHDGDRADGRWGEIIRVKNPPITGTPTVTENAVALTVGLSYSATVSYDVLVSDPEQGVLTRGPRASTLLADQSWCETAGWAAGLRNIGLGYLGGFDPVPDDILVTAAEIVWKRWQRGKGGDLDSYATSAGVATIAKDLSEFARETIERYTLTGRR